jgi:AcrR family transcriptional regulator
VIPGHDRESPGATARALDERERIATALVDLCFEGSYRETTLPMLLDRAAVDEAGFRAHFADLEDCFCEVYTGMRDELMERVATVAAVETTWRDTIRATAYVMVDWVGQDEKRTKFTVYEVRTAGERAMVLMGEAFEELFDLIDRGRDEAARPGMSRATAEAIGGSIFGQMYAAYETGSIEAVRAKVPEMMYIALLPYLGEEEAAKELRLGSA